MKVWDSARYSEEFMQAFVVEQKENILFIDTDFSYHEWDAGTKQLFVKVGANFDDLHYQNLQNALQEITSTKILVALVKNRVPN